MIHTFTSLTPSQRASLHRYMATFGHPAHPDRLEAMIRMFGGPAFTHGNTQWSLWAGDCPVAALGAVTEVWESKGEIYLTSIYATPPEREHLDPLLEVAMAVLEDRIPCRLKLSAHPFVPGLPEWAMAHGFAFDYQMVEMAWVQPRPSPPSLLTWHPVSQASTEAYRQVSNAAFLGSPNGAVIDPEGMQNLLEDHRDHPDCLVLGRLHGEAAVSLSLEIRHHQGQRLGIIDGLGVAPHLQGRGLGRQGLHEAIRRLQAHTVDQILLTVIDANRPAISLYHAEGFEITRTLSATYVKSMLGSAPHEP